MVNEVRASLPPPEPFVWERTYGPLWSGDGDSAFWLAPEPDDVLMIDGIRAPMREHIDGSAKRRLANMQQSMAAAAQGGNYQRYGQLQGQLHNLLGR